MRILFFLSFLLFFVFDVFSQSSELANCNVVWTAQSKNSSESMPCGGGDIGLNVWVENGELLFYLSRSGAFDENNQFLKFGRVRVRLSPNPFEGKTFQQELSLIDGSVKITGTDGALLGKATVWADVFRPVVHVDLKCNKPVKIEATYESWRYFDRLLTGRANRANSYRWEPQGEVKTYKDSVSFRPEGILFYHQNRNDKSVFDLTVKQQGMESVKSQLFDPLKNLVFGGMMMGENMQAAGYSNGKYADTEFKGWKLQSIRDAREHHLEVLLHIDQTPSVKDWEEGLKTISEEAKSQKKTAQNQSVSWWAKFWDRSFVFIQSSTQNTPEYQAGRNYQLSRYMLGCNAYGKYPTKFNGGLFTYDPVFIDTANHFTPDFRLWGGGTFTAQNQRLVYFPMLKSGDVDMMKSQFDFYLRILGNAELRSGVYWGHKGACFTEQLENFGLPNCTEYGWKRPVGTDPGVEYNAWLEYEWDTVLEFCLMILDKERYTGQDISEYLPLIESSLRFFDEHYQYLAKKRGRKALDGDGHLVLYPGSAGETFKMAYNATSTVAALKTITARLLELPQNYLNDIKRKDLSAFAKRIPSISFTEFNGRRTIAPARLWERVNNVETMQLYPVYPWRMYGVGKPDLDVAINTWMYDTLAVKFRSAVGWKQDNIWAACLGLTDEAARLNIAKMKDSNRRFPAFWGPGFDWTPDINHAGSGMIGLQEMLLQTDGEKIFLFPAWPRQWDVHFKLHAPYNTIIEGLLKDGKLEFLKIVPQSRSKDVTNLLNKLN